MGLGFGEMAVLLAIVLVIFGAGKLPSAMSDIAKGVRAFKSGLKDGPAATETAATETAATERATPETAAKPAEPLRLVDRTGERG